MDKTSLYNTGVYLSQALLDELELDESVMEEADGEAGNSVSIPDHMITVPQHGQEVKVREDHPSEDPSEGDSSGDLHDEGTDDGGGHGAKVLADLCEGHFGAVGDAGVVTGALVEGREEGEEEEEQVGHTHSSEHGSLLT